MTSTVATGESCTKMGKRQTNIIKVGSGGHVVECWTVNRGDGGSFPPTAVSKLRQFCLPPHLTASFGRD